MSCLIPGEWTQWYDHAKQSLSADLQLWATSVSGTLALIATAEIGDKSQLVCMTLAARHRALPVVLGASCAFALLNLAAVLFGATVANWIPQLWVDITVAALFLVFGIKALLTDEDVDDVSERPTDYRGAFITTFLMIFAAEFGDKTQLAVAALSATSPPAPVWIGASLALIMTSALGVWAGRAILQRIPVHWLHRISGLMFIGFAGYTAWPLIPKEIFIEWLSKAN